MFSPSRLELARKRRKITARALAERAGVTPDTISRLQQGSNEPDASTIHRLAVALNYPVAFFDRADVADVDSGSVSFRSFSKMSAKERDAAVSAGSLGVELGSWVEQKFKLPALNLPDLSFEVDPYSAAFGLRQFWGIGEKPISSMIGMMESNGVKVFSLAENTAAVNAFSFWRDGSAYVFLNNFKTAESSIFDAAHELGHLVMHKQGDPKESRALEREANAFAAALLIPERDLKSRIPSEVTLDFVLKAKKRWRVSAMALVHRLRSILAISDWQYKSFCIELSRLGYRSGEPNGIAREQSIVWKKILDQLWRERITKQDIADELYMPLDEINSLIVSLSEERCRPEGRGELHIVG